LIENLLNFYVQKIQLTVDQSFIFNKALFGNMPQNFGSTIRANTLALQKVWPLRPNFDHSTTLWS
jgi:hypothetical protein